MKRFTDAGRACIESDNLYAGLSLALMMPDICASLEDPGPGKSKERYERWCRNWVEPKFTSNPGGGAPKVFVTAEDCYQIRCSLIHSGRADIDPKKVRSLSRFEFFDRYTGSHLILCENIRINGVERGGFLQLKADEFSLAMFDAADEWDRASVHNSDVSAEKAKLLTIHSAGTTLGGGAIHVG